MKISGIKVPGSMVHGRSLAFLWLAPMALVLIMFQLAPLGWVILNAFRVSGQWSLGNFIEIGSSAFYRQAIWQSLVLSVLSGVIGLLIALVACHSLTRVPGRLQRAVIAFTNMTSNFVGVPLAFAFIILMGTNGVLSLILREWGITGPDLYSGAGLLVIYVWFQVPLGILLLYPAMEGLDASWREAAALLGAGRLAWWRHIALPVLTPALLGTLTILFANAMGTYATVYALVNNSYNLITIRIANLVAGDLFLEPELASALALILVISLAVMVGVQQWLAGRYARGAR